MITEQQLIEQGQRLIVARRHLWDMERKLGLRPWDGFLRTEVKRARIAYRVLLEERVDLVTQAQETLL